MKTYKSPLINPEDYNTALFEVGCVVAEDQYSPSEASLVTASKEYWLWLCNQQRIVDVQFARLLTQKEIKPGKAFNIYYQMLFEHVSGVYFSEKLKNKMTNKIKKS